MLSAINQIQKIENDSDFILNKTNNRYCFTVDKNRRNKTAYCFSVPILDENLYSPTNRLLNYKKGFYYIGTSSLVFIEKNILFKNKYLTAEVSIDASSGVVQNNVIIFDKNRIFPTTNGLGFKLYCHSKEIRFKIKCSDILLGIRANIQCLSIMRDDFCAALTISSIGSIDADNNILSPCVLEYVERQNGEFEVIFKPSNTSAEYILFEINSYEQKLLQDSTVQSEQPQTNNAFGGVAYIGKTKEYGEQLLYSKINLELIPELLLSRIKSVKLYCPILYNNNAQVSVHTAKSRFCSLGITWNNRAELNFDFSTTKLDNEYLCIDLTSSVVDMRTKQIKRSDGWVVKSAKENSGYIALATGDSFMFPQIVEIVYT